MFARMEKVPSFELSSVGLGPVDDDSPSEPMPQGGGMQSDERYQQLWRKYKLRIPDFECEILEVFPARDMFIRGTYWLDNKPLDHKTTSLPSADATKNSATTPYSRTGLVLSLGLASLLAIALGVRVSL